MNSGRAFATSMTIQRFDEGNVFLYEETYDLLDGYGSVSKVQIGEWMHASEEEILARIASILSYLRTNHFKNDKPVIQYAAIRTDMESCPVPFTHVESSVAGGTLLDPVETTLEPQHTTPAPRIYYNSEQCGEAIRNNCSEGYYSVDPVRYCVPAGTYSSTSQRKANQLAKLDVENFKQGYANQNGICIPIPTTTTTTTTTQRPFTTPEPITTESPWTPEPTTESPTDPPTEPPTEGPTQPGETTTTSTTTTKKPAIPIKWLAKDDVECEQK